MRWRIVVDKLRSRVTENERKTQGKLNRDTLCDIYLRVCLDSSARPLPSLLICWTTAPADLWPVPPVCAAMEQLVSEVSVLLKMLDQESLSSSTQEKKTSVWNLLQQIQPPGKDVELTSTWSLLCFCLLKMSSFYILDSRSLIKKKKIQNGIQNQNICYSMNLWIETFIDVILGKLCSLMATLIFCR